MACTPAERAVLRELALVVRRMLDNPCEVIRPRELIQACQQLALERPPEASEDAPARVDAPEPLAVPPRAVNDG